MSSVWFIDLCPFLLPSPFLPSHNDSFIAFEGATDRDDLDASIKKFAGENCNYLNISIIHYSMAGLDDSNILS